mmetsp:Transcript_33125/g.43624  ORF Transcript_33125/g.43624 Transcript_33125/m.43624 type:complete len:627 (+) Transcript_33125:35-1915(+)
MKLEKFLLFWFLISKPYILSAYSFQYGLSKHRFQRSLPLFAKNTLNSDHIGEESSEYDLESLITVSRDDADKKLRAFGTTDRRYLSHGISESDWSKLLSIGEQKSLKEGDIITEEGTGSKEQPKTRKVSYILDGKVVLETRGWRVVKLGPGNFLGESSLLRPSRGPRSATSRCLTNVEIVQWDQQILKEALQNNLDLRAGIQAYWNEELAGKLRRALQKYEDVTPYDFKTITNITVGDYGYVRAVPPSGGLSKITPASGWRLAFWNFGREFNAIRRSFRFAKDSEQKNPQPSPLSKINDFFLTNAIKADIWLEEKFDFYRTLSVSLADQASKKSEVAVLREKLAKLSLDNDAIWRREEVRRDSIRSMVKSTEVSPLSYANKIRKSETSPLILVPYFFLCYMIDVVFNQRPIQRFWFLETIARMPYFSYISMLHLYETLGWWGVGEEVRKVHFAEEWNELRHLKIMESLGGDNEWFDRFLARHTAIIYYWILNLAFLINPRLAYNFSELIEFHAVDSYGQFLDENEEILKSLPPPLPAVKYYMSGDMYLFDDFQTSRLPNTRRPKISSLYDVFLNIKEDELEHVKTMTACQITDEDLMSPNTAVAEKAWGVQEDEDDFLFSEEFEKL